MKVLLLSVTAGQGHNSCANAIKAALQERNIESTVLDTIKFIDKISGSIVDKGYTKLTTAGKVSPKVWGAMYNQALKSSINKGPIDEIIPNLINFRAKKLEEFINDYRPDAIISTHIFASMLVSGMRKQNIINIPLIGINTDFALHPFWEEIDGDYLVTACDRMDYAVLKRGIPKNKILPLGIPVSSKFSKIIEKSEARKLLNIKDKPTISLFSGSMGFGNILEEVKSIDKLELDFQLIVICGNNTSVLEDIQKAKKEGKYQKDIIPLGFVDNVNEIMSASDVVCTKPGGLSVSECMSIGRPLALLEPIPGIEEFNASFLVNCGAAVKTDKFYTIAEAIYNLMSSPKRIQSMLGVQSEMSPKNSAREVASITMDLINKK